MTGALITLTAISAVVAVVLLLDLGSSRRQRRRLASGGPRPGSDRRGIDSRSNEAAVESSARNAVTITYGT
ncbi:hypothetical protein [Nocardioides perillae]|uniref:Uncharacterized protein n=1 Tax=Nocardioides perillae TaxID=1119534 RepID=A0A7Y9UV87_9ACTN|nr:hypothetical protein [Nocardioides perillae]NYG55905.1 hypothetical protein [Nocardioides perillae]